MTYKYIQLSKFVGRSSQGFVVIYRSCNPTSVFWIMLGLGLDILFNLNIFKYITNIYIRLSRMLGTTCSRFPFKFTLSLHFMGCLNMRTWTGLRGSWSKMKAQVLIQRQTYGTIAKASASPTFNSNWDGAFNAMFFWTNLLVIAENSGAGATIPSYAQSTLWVNAVGNNHCSVLPLRCNDSQSFEPGEKREQSEDHRQLINSICISSST